jgi:hypothetical protein
VDEQKVRVTGINTESITVERVNPPIGGEYVASRDGASSVFDLLPVMGATDVWRVRVTLHNDPVAEWDSDTLTVSQERTVRGPSAPTEIVITDIVLTAPLVGDDTVTIEVETTSEPTYVMLVDTRWWLLGDIQPEFTEDVATTPALGAPSGTQTVTIDTGHVRAGGYADGSEVTVNYEVRIRVEDGSGNHIDSLSRETHWYIEAELPE